MCRPTVRNRLNFRMQLRRCKIAAGEISGSRSRYPFSLAGTAVT